MLNLPAWLSPDIDNLLQLHQNNALPHGLLIVGHQGDGREQAVDQLVAGLLCTESSLSACGNCKSCLLRASGHHPDLIKLEPEGKSLTIKVDAVRLVSRHLSETAQQGGNKVVWIDSAENMNPNAANALLKVLEEPTPNTFLIIASNELSGTLPTVRSRCRIVKLTTPTAEQSLGFLNQLNLDSDINTALGISNGRPMLAAKVTQEDIADWFECERMFATASSFMELSRYVQKRPMTSTLKQVLMWVEVGIKLASGLKLKQEPVSDALINLVSSKSKVSLFQFRDYIVNKVSAERRHANLNGQLLAEELTAQWLILRGNE